MRELLGQRLRELARRAGMAGVPTPVLVAGLALLCVAVIAALLRWWPQPSDAGAAVTRAPAAREARAAGSPGGFEGDVASSATAGSSAPAGLVCVHVVGAVHHPGVYSLADGSRVESAVDAAGGMTTAAEPSAINLAAKLADGEQVVVPTTEQVRSGAVRAPAGGSAAGAGVGGVAAGGAGTAPAAKVNVNTADATQLDALPGVGPSTAAKIVADRQANGPYRTVDDLGRVPGIGPKKLGDLKPLVCVH